MSTTARNAASIEPAGPAAGSAPRNEPVAGGRAIARVRAMSLSQKFLLASTLAIVCAMGIVGTWISGRIESSVNHNAALDSALYVEAVVGERIQGLADAPRFDPLVQRGLEQLVLKTPLGRRILSFKVWIKGGRVVYASSPDHVGRSYAPTKSLMAAWKGSIQFEFDRLDDEEDQIENQLNLPLLEIYVPVRRRFGGDVIAIVEFYTEATQLAEDLTRARRQGWLLLAAIGAAVVAALYGMARQASNTIDRQQAELNDRIVDLSALLAQNLGLRQRVEAASRRAAALNERHLRRIGSDLHDGPAQMISLALLRLDAMPLPKSADPTAVVTRALPMADEKAKIRSALEHALREIRELSVGLSMPELDDKSLSAIVSEAVREHEHRAETRVGLSLDPLPARVISREVKLAAFRFVQEALNNARRHAPGARAQVACRMGADGMVAITVEDDGPGFDPDAVSRTDRLGLAGMRERIESLGGTLKIDSVAGTGSRLEASLPFTPGEPHGA